MQTNHSSKKRDYKEVFGVEQHFESMKLGDQKLASRKRMPTEYGSVQIMPLSKNVQFSFRDTQLSKLDPTQKIQDLTSFSSNLCKNEQQSEDCTPHQVKRDTFGPSTAENSAKSLSRGYHTAEREEVDQNAN